jgi:hypothetical protein
MVAKKALMVKTKNRNFFTNQENLPLLTEFAKAFNAEICLVKVNSDYLLPLKTLAPAMCDATYESCDDYILIDNA